MGEWQQNWIFGRILGKVGSNRQRWGMHDAKEHYSICSKRVAKKAFCTLYKAALLLVGLIMREKTHLIVHNDANIYVFALGYGNNGSFIKYKRREMKITDFWCT